MKILCVGDIGLDHYISRDEIYPGGCSLNVAYAIKKNGGDVGILSPVGNCENSKKLERFVDEYGINNHLVRQDGNPPVQEIKNFKGGEKDFCRYIPNVIKEFKLDESYKKLIESYDVVVSVCFSENKKMYESLLKLDIQRPVVTDFMTLTDVSIEELADYIEKLDMACLGLGLDDDHKLNLLHKMSIDFKRKILITLGAEGSVFIENGDSYPQKADQASQVIDTTGAGDSFIGAFSASFYKDFEIQRALNKASQYAARTVGHFGAIPTKPL